MCHSCSKVRITNTIMYNRWSEGTKLKNAIHSVKWSFFLLYQWWHEDGRYFKPLIYGSTAVCFNFLYWMANWLYHPLLYHGFTYLGPFHCYPLGAVKQVAGLHECWLRRVHALPLLHLQDLPMHGLLHTHDAPALNATPTWHRTGGPGIVLPTRETHVYLANCILNVLRLVRDRE